MKEECLSCKFWSPFPIDENDDFKRGTCKRYPPVFDPSSVDVDSCNPFMWTQPSTYQSGWCGEYEHGECSYEG